MMRISQKENINILDRGFIWKYLFLTIIHTNTMEEVVMKEVVTNSSLLIQKCIQELEQHASDDFIPKIARVFFFCMGAIAALCGTSEPIQNQLSAYCERACIYFIVITLIHLDKKASRYILLFQHHPRTTFLILSSEQLENVVKTINTTSELHLVLLSVLLGSFNPASAYKLQEKQIEEIREVVSRFLSLWSSLSEMVYFMLSFIDFIYQSLQYDA